MIGEREERRNEPPKRSGPFEVVGQRIARSSDKLEKVLMETKDGGVKVFGEPDNSSRRTEIRVEGGLVVVHANPPDTGVNSSAVVDRVEVVRDDKKPTHHLEVKPSAYGERDFYDGEVSIGTGVGLNIGTYLAYMHFGHIEVERDTSYVQTGVPIWLKRQLS